MAGLDESKIEQEQELSAGPRAPNPQWETPQKVKDLMATEVKSCATHNTLNTAAQTMWDNDIGCVSVVDNDRRVIAMLTDRDVCMAAYIQGVPLTGSLVTSAMSKQVFSCAFDDDVASAERLMRDKQVRRLPVTDSAPPREQDRESVLFAWCCSWMR